MADKLGGNAAAKLKASIAGILDIGDQIVVLQREAARIYKAARADGLDGKAMRRLVRRLRTNKADWETIEETDYMYWVAYNSGSKAQVPEQVPVPPQPKPPVPPPPIEPPPAPPPARHIDTREHHDKAPSLPVPTPPVELEDELPPELEG